MRGDGLKSSDLLRGAEIPDALLRDLPKMDLHAHLDGSLRLPTFLELCREQEVALPGGSEEAARRILTAENVPGLEAYIGLFDHPIAILQDEGSLRRAARELVEDCAAENVWHVEIRFSPSLHVERGLSLEKATDAVLAGVREAQAATGCSAGLVITGVRHRPPQESLELARLAVEYKGKGVVGFDLAGREADYPAKDHLAAFYEILNHNINCTVHAGEAWGPESIHQALHYLGAHRIGHGTRLLEDEGLTRYMADHRIPVEVGLSSSVRTGAIPSPDRHPLRRFLARGIRVVLTTNNRLFLSNTLSDELRLAVDTFDLSLLEIENLIVASFKSAFLPQAERVGLLRKAIGGFSAARRNHGLEGGEE